MHSVPQLLGCSLVITGIVSVNCVAAADEKETLSIFQAINDRGPWNEPRSEFDALLNKPNATGKFPIAGPNISTPYSETRPIDGWSWSIDVVADFPIANSKTQAAHYGTKFYTGGKVTLNAPISLLSSSGNLTVDDDWQVCVFGWQLDGADYPDKLRTDDGTCSSLLTSECISGIYEAATKMNFGGNCICPLSRDIPSCARLGNDSELWDMNNYAGLYNATRIREWKDGKLDVEVYGGGTAHDRGNSTAYNYIGSLAWPRMVSFGTKNQSAISLTCVRAVNATEGSTAPTGEGLADETDQGNGTTGGQDEPKSDGTLVQISILQSLLAVASASLLFLA